MKNVLEAMIHNTLDTIQPRNLNKETDKGHQTAYLVAEIVNNNNPSSRATKEKEQQSRHRIYPRLTNIYIDTSSDNSDSHYQKSIDNNNDYHDNDPKQILEQKGNEILQKNSGANLARVLKKLVFF